MGRLKRFLPFAPSPWLRWKIGEEVAAADEIPAVIPKRRAVIVRSGRTPTWVAFDCPCGTGHRIMLNLDGGRRPHWSITKPSPLTIYPSVDDATSTRRCHFFIRGGRVVWARDDFELRHER